MHTGQCQCTKGRWQGEAWARSSQSHLSAVEKATRANRRGQPKSQSQPPSVSAGAPGETPPKCRKGGTSRLTRAKPSPSFRMSPCEAGPNPSLLTPSPSPRANPKTELGGQGASAGPPRSTELSPALAGAAETRTSSRKGPDCWEGHEKNSRPTG